MEEYKTFISVIIFVFVLFMYLHIIAQWKTSEDLEVYETDFVNRTQLQEICELKQPLLFKMDVASNFFRQIQKPFMDKHDHNEIKIKDVYEYGKPDITSVDSIVLPLRSALQLTEQDTHQRYVSENNSDFIEESGLEKNFAIVNEHLVPHFNVHTKYDLMFGSKNAHMPLKYHTNSRYYMAVSSGKIHVKMAPWKSSKFLHKIKDYDNFEFFSPIDVWKCQPKYLGDYEKIKFLEFDVNSGFVLYIPPYWWYSVCFSTDNSTMITCFTHNTLINCVTNSYDWGLHYLQSQNISSKVLNSASSIPSIDSISNISAKPVEETPIENKLGQNEDIPQSPKETTPIVTNSGIYNP